MKFLKFQVRFELHGSIYGFVWTWRDGFEVVQLDADVDRPFVIKTLYKGHDIHAANRAVKGLEG